MKVNLENLLENIDFELSVEDISIDELVKLIEDKREQILDKYDGYGSYISYDEYNKKYIHYIETSYHGSPVLEETVNVTEKDNKFLRASKAFLDILE